MPELYTELNLQTYDFVPEMLAKFTDEMSKMYPKGWDVWDQYRGIDGVTEYVASDIIEYQIYQHLKLHGRSYEMYTDDSPHAAKHYREFEWERPGVRARRTGVPSLDFRAHLPHPLHSFEDVNSLLDLSDCLDSLRRNRADTLFGMWIAEVYGAIAYGNGPAEAITHAWGISQGIWQPDKPPHSGQWVPVGTIGPDA